MEQSRIRQIGTKTNMAIRHDGYLFSLLESKSWFKTFGVDLNTHAFRYCEYHTIHSLLPIALLSLMQIPVLIGISFFHTNSNRCYQSAGKKHILCEIPHILQYKFDIILIMCMINHVGSYI